MRAMAGMSARVAGRIESGMARACPGRSAAQSDALLTRDLTKFRARHGPGSAVRRSAERSVLHRVGDSKKNAPAFGRGVDIGPVTYAQRRSPMKRSRNRNRLMKSR